MNRTQRAFCQFMKNFEKQVRNQAFQGNDRVVKGMALTFIGSLGAWYLMQEFHPTKLDSVKDLTKTIQSPDISNFMRTESKPPQFVEDVKRLVKPVFSLVPQYAEENEITDQTSIIERAKILAAKDGRGVLEYIKENKIRNKKSVIEILKIIAAEDGDGVSEYIHEYGITDQKALVEIAKIAAAQDGGAVSYYIKNYGITDQEALIEIAKIAVKNSWAFSCYIYNYEISDQKALIDIAKIAAAQSRSGFSSYIWNYGITDQKALIEIAKIAAAQDGRGVSEHIHNYGITDPKALIEIAKIAAAQDGGAVSCYIKRYGITDPKALIEIAKIAAPQDGGVVSYYIKNYGFTDPKALVEIAKIAAAQDGRGVSEYIQRYGITDQEALIEIAKIAAAAKGGRGVSEYIHKYGIRDPKALIEIAKIAAAQDGWEVSYYIWNYGITDQEALIEIAKIAAAQNGRAVSEYIHNYGITDPKALVGIAKIIAMKYGGEWTLELDGVFEKIFAHRGRAMVSYLLASFIQESKNHKYEDIYKKLSGNLLEERILPSIIPSKWVANTTSSLDSQEVRLLNQFLETQSKPFESNEHFIKSAFLEAVKLLDETEKIPAEKKIEILSKICSQDRLLDIVKTLRLITYFINAQDPAVLLSASLEAPLEELNQIFEQKIIEYLGSSSLKGDELMNRYQNTFGKLRVPYGLEIFQKALQQEGPSVKQTLERFVQSVLIGDFLEQRHRIDNNPHLMKIHEHHSNLLDRWKKFTFEAKTVTSSAANNNRFFFGSFLQDRLSENHFSQNDLPVLFSALRPEFELRLDSQEDKELIMVQNMCIDLIKNYNIPRLKNVIEILERKMPDLELLNDLKSLTKEDVSSKNEKVLFTQDWEDLFLCGTEVEGSCQRVDGSSSLNKCLLAYCLDGKNGMVAIKDQNSGKILARSMLRLLWDPKEEKPVLFLDRIYPLTSSEERRNVIINAAKECASDLGLELFEHSASSDKEIVALGGPCPYEYADGAEGVMAEGKFRVFAKRL